SLTVSVVYALFFLCCTSSIFGYLVGRIRPTNSAKRLAPNPVVWRLTSRHQITMASGKRLGVGHSLWAHLSVWYFYVVKEDEEWGLIFLGALYSYSSRACRGR
ncbi:unnamed protein product, partial [Ectocarpus sp. 8 AP-2014]